MKSLFLLSLALVSYSVQAQFTPKVLRTLYSANEETGGQFGESVAAVGRDVNADGIVDLVIGARSEDPGLSAINSGRAYIMSGSDGSVIHTLISPNPEYWGYFGSSVAGLSGDVNADWIGDVVVGAPYEDPGTSPVDCGRAYVYSGLDGSVIYELISPFEVAGGQFGSVVSGLGGDVDGDGIPDLLVGAPYEQSLFGPAAAGRVHVYSGVDGSFLYSLVSPNEEASGFLGWSAAGIGGDADGDGIFDIIASAYLEDPGTSPSNAGRAYIFSGADGSLLQELVSPNEESNGYFGRSVSGAGGDLDGDGRQDVLVGAFWENPNSSPVEAGRAYAFSGATGSLIYTFISPGEKENGWFGYSVSGTRADANGDGVPEVLVGAPLEGENAGLNAESGRAYLFSGADCSLLQTLVSPALEPNSWFGSAMSEAGGDVDGDGEYDFVVGAERQDIGSSPFDAGNAHVFSGKGVSCSTATAPDNQQHVNLANRVVLSWDPQEGAQGCQIQGKRLPAGPQPTASVLTPLFNSIQIPYSVAGAGTTWTWRVRCACNLSPIVATPYSTYGDTFNIPVSREGQMLDDELVLYPVPAMDQLQLSFLSQDQSEELLTIYDLTGRMVQQSNWSVQLGENLLSIGLKGYESGVYLLQVGNRIQRTFTVQADQ